MSLSTSRPRNLYDDENAQATTEYILLLAIIVVLLVGLIKKLIQPALEKLAKAVTNRFETILFGGNLHQIRRR